MTSSLSRRLHSLFLSWGRMEGEMRLAKEGDIGRDRPVMSRPYLIASYHSLRAIKVIVIVVIIIATHNHHHHNRESGSPL